VLVYKLLMGGPNCFAVGDEVSDLRGRQTLRTW
jgi:hypothetical protein